MKNVSRFSALGLVLTAGICISAQPVQNINSRNHPNLAAAQRLTAQAAEKISAAQAANEFDMNGHAKKAKELLDEANNELRMAATEANRNKR